MPELPDVTIYVEALSRFAVGGRIDRVEVRSPFLVRSFEPEIAAVEGKKVEEVRRLGKRIVWRMEGGLFLVFHLMIAGRFHWRKPGASVRGKNHLAAFRFRHGTLLLTEASPKKRASLYVVEGAGVGGARPRRIGSARLPLG